MKHFTINAENNITVHASRKAARDTGAGVFATEEQLADLIGPDNKRLVAIWNSLPGVKPATKFANRKVATERIWRVIQELGKPTTGELAPKPTDGEVVADTAQAQIPATEPSAERAEGKPTLEASTPPPSVESAAAPVENPPSAAPAEPMATVSAQAPDVAPTAAKASKKTTKSKTSAQPTPTANAKDAREGSKTATILELLKRPGGASLKEIMDVASWQAHSVRGFISGTLGKKMGLTVLSVKAESGERRYSINS
jgi:Protein of unknown function (DUF3489)